MALFRLTKQSIEALPETEFATHGLRERGDLQRLLKANVEMVASDVLVIAEEFAEWEDSRRRIDLLGIDRKGNLVVIELKRDSDGGHMDLQAIRYAAMVSTMKFARAVEVYQAFLDKASPGSNARARILEFLGLDEPQEDDFGQDVRIILVGADFSKELTTAVMWLNDRQLDIRCVRLKPYRLQGEVIVDAQPIVPLPEAEAYTIQLRQKGQAVRQEQAERSGDRLAYWSELLPRAAKVLPRFKDLTPGTDNWLGATAGHSGLRFVFLAWMEESAAEMYIDRGVEHENKAIYDYLEARRGEIESAFGGPLSWQRLEGKRAARVRTLKMPGGIAANRDQWPAIQQAVVDAMHRLERALGPHLGPAITALAVRR